jgi:hypothetical protein
MGKNKLFSAMAAAIVGVAGIANMSNAININPDGSGQVLIYPYYTIDGGNDTLISVVNTANEVKAVKVRFHDSFNSNEPLDFHLYLSPFDVWTGVVTRGANDNGTQLPILFTNDTSCTVPDIRTNAQLPQLADGTRFVTFSSAVMNSPAAAARSGYIEMLEMGVVNDVGGGGPGQPLFIPATWATHVNGVPDNCDALVNAWANVTWTAGSGRGIWALQQNTPIPAMNIGGSVGITRPTGGLFGSGLVINGSTGRNVSYAATALEGFNFTTVSGNMHANPTDTRPNIATYGQGPQQANIFVGGRLVSSTFGGVNPAGESTGQVEAVSALLAAENVVNEFAFSVGSTAFTTEWVITFPTKRFHAFRPGTPLPPAIAPFTDNTTKGFGCEAIRIRAYDREEYVYPIVQFSPGAQPALCGEVNVVNFEFLPPGVLPVQGVLPPLAGGRTTVLGAPENLAVGGINRSLTRIALPRPPSAPTTPIIAGWADLTFIDPRHVSRQSVSSAGIPGLIAPDLAGDQWSGLPYIGFNVLGAGNTAGQISAFYAGAVPHRGQRRCTNLITQSCAP